MTGKLAWRLDCGKLAWRLDCGKLAWRLVCLENRPGGDSPEVIDV
jgi:hypothetical protein